VGRGAGAERGLNSVRGSCEHLFAMDSNRKGAIAEMKIATAATELGVPVLRPMTERERYDLAFELGGRLLRVQCKWASFDQTAGVIKVGLQGSWLSAQGYVRSSYSEDEIDLLAVYCADLERCYLLPSSMVAGRRAIYLRVSPSRNAQRACINLGTEYELSGAVAQWNERSAGSRKVVGSNPTSSTPDPSAVDVGCHQFRNHFGYYLERAAAGDEIRISRRGRPYARLVPAEPAQPELAAA
jgi:prevent-host-death family protein